MITLRIFSQDHSLDDMLATAAEETLGKHWPELLDSSKGPASPKQEN